jgi:hypothetical protein
MRLNKTHILVEFFLMTNKIIYKKEKNDTLNRVHKREYKKYVPKENKKNTIKLK